MWELKRLNAFHAPLAVAGTILLLAEQSLVLTVPAAKGIGLRRGLRFLIPSGK